MNSRSVRSLLLITTSLLLTPLSVYAAQPWGSCVIDNVPTIYCLVPLFANIITAVVSLAGVALFIMFIVGGFSFLTSGGNPKQLEQARNTLTYAIIGIVVMVASYLILLLIGAFTGLPNLTIFQLPTP